MSNNRSKIVNCQPICCNLCGSEESAPLFEGRDRLHGLKGRFTYVRCRQCSLIYMNPQIMPEELGRYYTSGYVPHRLKSDKKSNRSGLNLRRLPHLQYLCSILTEQSRVLDVGCGNGTFLHQVKSLKGCQVEGVDISEAAARTAEENYELKIFVGPVSDAPFLNGYFDVITAWSFLEHVNDPSLVLAKVSDLLKEDGVFLVSTPNFESFNAKLFKDKWYHLDCPRHLYIYTPQTLSELLKKSGLAATKVVYEKSSKGIMGSIQYYVYGDNYDPKHSNKLRRSRLLKTVVSPLAWLAAVLHQSDYITLYAKKGRNVQ